MTRGMVCEMAKNIFPIIEIDAGRKVDFVMVRGMSLNPKSKSGRGSNLQGGVRSLDNIYSGQQDGFGQQLMGSMLGGRGGRQGGSGGFGGYGGSGNSNNSYGYGR